MEKSSQVNIFKRLKRKIELTVTRFKPDKFAPRHNPVDIAPQPE